MPRQPTVLALCVPLLIALALAPATAGAKEVVAATVCGAEECVRVPDDQLSTRLVMGGSTSVGPERREPWYRVRVKIGAKGIPHDAFGLTVLPRGGYIGGFAEGAGSSYDWTTIDDRTAALYRRLVKGVEPHPAARLDLPREPKLTLSESPAVPATNLASSAEEQGGGIAVAGVIAGVALLAVAAFSWRRRRGNVA